VAAHNANNVMARPAMASADVDEPPDDGRGRQQPERRTQTPSQPKAKAETKEGTGQYGTP